METLLAVENDPDGTFHFYLADSANHSVAKFSAARTLIKFFGMVETPLWPASCRLPLSRASSGSVSAAD